MICKTCKGSGLDANGIHCPDCRGYGRKLNRMGWIEKRGECPKCCGFKELEQYKGRSQYSMPVVERVICPDCDGTGKKKKEVKE